MAADPLKAEELTAVIREIQDRVRSRHPSGALGPGSVAVPDLLPLVHARDAAEGKVAAIGTVNPRRGGPLNAVIQTVKRLVARALDWHVREQVEFNRALIGCVQAALDALSESNRAMAQLDAQVAALRSELMQEMSARSDALLAEARELKDVRTHWAEWRAGWEEKLNRGEVYMLRTISELNASFQHRATLTENEFRSAMRDQHGSIQSAMRDQHDKYENALQRAGAEIQKRLWDDLERIRREYEETIQAELRVVRQRGLAQSGGAAPPVAQSGAQAPPVIDWLRFADRFRGSEEKVRAAQSSYTARFAGASDVLDIGCGRGEFLEAAAQAGIHARGIDLNEENVALCRAKGLDAEVADLFDYLARQADESLGGLYCSQVIEHLPPGRLPELVRLAAGKLKRGALAAFETPNPECLAIFATHFYLDPTHTKPVPPALMAFYLEEAGFGRIEVVRLSPAVESVPGIAELAPALRASLFGGLDYAVFAVKL